MPARRPHHSKKAPHGAQQLRIIGGQWRGRKLSFPSADGLRPTGDRTRETLFNWLVPDLHNAQCLDLFSGSGALGIEALSRGAAHTTFLETNAVAVQQLKKNLQLLDCQQSRVEQTDALHWLNQTPNNQADIVFIDPPFALDLWDQIIERLDRHHWLRDQAAIYIESPKKVALHTPANWHMHREKVSGDVCYRLYYYQPDGCPS